MQLRQSIEFRGKEMIKLRNLSKFYYSKGIIASGLSRINLDLEMGEFVVITGESGSGKSTLINVISGLDTYEEGEMYIEGQETSHYSVGDFEEYRKKYIANIFQNFNLVSSYTVYQNIELILLIEGRSSADVKDKVNDIIDKVGLTEYRNTKVSKLSGGQKQRVAIARALAKETPIIVADEPTGNLDSESAEIVVRLLSELSKDRLVIVVTHNYDQFEKYATRRIKLNDGKLNEDDKIKAVENSQDMKPTEFDKIKAASKLKLGFRNTFNLIPKFILTLFVFLFLVFAVGSQYTSYKAQNDTLNNLGFNSFFMNGTDDRIVFKKQDNTPLTDADYEQVKKLKNVARIEKNDLILDTNVYIEGESTNLDGYPASRENMPKKLVAGRLPEADDEIVVSYYSFNKPQGEPKAIFDDNLKINLDGGGTIKCKIVGLAVKDSNTISLSGASTLHMSDALLQSIKNSALRRVTNVELTINGKKVPSSEGSMQLVANEKVPAGNAFVTEEVDAFYDNGVSKGKKIDIQAKNIYYTDTITVTSQNTYNKSNYKKLLGTEDEYDMVSGKIYINPQDYNYIFEKPDYQSSVFIKDTDDDKLAAVEKELDKLGYKTISLKKAKTSMDELSIINLIRVPMFVIMTVAIFFICYFVIKLILKSRGVYFSILRMLGLDMKSIKQVLDIEMLTIIHIAYGLFMGFAYLVKIKVVDVTTIQNMVKFFALSDYIILYIIVIAMSLIISRKFAKALFKSSAMNSYREGAQ